MTALSEANSLRAAASHIVLMNVGEYILLVLSVANMEQTTRKYRMNSLTSPSKYMRTVSDPYSAVTSCEVNRK